MDPLARLGRKDKWFLGGGQGALYAPPFPKHLLATGFWDECYLGDIKIPRLFTALFVDADGRPIRFESYHKGWRPDRLTIMHYSGDVVIRERRCVTEGNAWVTELELVTAVRPIHVFLWALPEVKPQGYGAPWQSMSEVVVQEDSVRIRLDTAWPSEIEPDRTGIESESIAGSARMGPALPLYLEFGASHPRQSWTVNLAQRHDESPLYEISVLPEKFRGGKLPGDYKPFVGTEPPEGLAHLVQHYILEDRRPLVLACGGGFTPEAARVSLEDARRDGVIDRSAEGWRSYFSGVPQFQSSDEFLTSAYWYRWYGLRLNTVGPSAIPPAALATAPRHPYVSEGIGFFRNFVTYSAQAHLREVAWMRDPSLAIGILDNLNVVQRPDGSLPGHSYSCRPARDFYHADFATGLRQLHALHPGSVGREHLQMLRQYADYFLRHRTLSKDPAGPTLYDVFDQNETGQEYMSRYQFASESADKWASFRVSGVDATVYAYRLFQTLADFRPVDSTYRRFAEGALRGLAELSFEPDESYFCDVAPDGSRSPARPLTGMYPYLLANELRDRVPHLETSLGKWLPDFDLPAGFPATAASDPTFSAEGEWKERRLNCPWNGRSWPMANSHLVDGLAAAARAFGGEWRPRAGAALQKAIRLMFHDGNPLRPNAYEHYDPVTGMPALYRGYDDYMHSWIVDLVMRHAVGVQPGNPEVDPIPTGAEWIECSNIPQPYGTMHVRIDGEKATVDIGES